MMDFCGVFNLDAEKIENKGEDATTFKFDENGNGYMFVFDGSGGAGSEKHLDLDGEKSAYIASRACALYCTDYFKSKKDEAINVSEFAEQIYAYLLRINQTYPMESSESTLVDVLPTTICGAIIKNEKDEQDITFVWGGDSRGYIIDDDGLSQLTEDDVNSRDAYYNLFDDSIMSNRIHGNPNKSIFEIHTSHIRLQKRGIVICSTDGCYDYFNSPMVFEFLLITMLATSDSFEEAKSKLLDVLNDKSGDDCSLVAAFYGFSDYSEVREFTQKRFEFLNHDKDNFDERYWNENYKKNYYRYNSLRSEGVAEN